jgi:hypothetical protein
VNLKNKYQGLWMWPELIRYRVNGGEIRRALLIDTEGVGSTNEEVNHDSKVFMMALLLSSLLVYNSVGVIDENAIQNLGFVIKLSNYLSSGSVDDRGGSNGAVGGEN